MAEPVDRGTQAEPGGPAPGQRAARSAHLISELVEAADDRALSRIIGRYARLNLLLLDELGYVQIGVWRPTTSPHTSR
ncbi:hypothetical protein [Kutzneria chonburiensis]|uniref:hypothetical protein n=1 Tax=Kutzneria chonburiensis TaxID=1483604 RepID=UPI0023620B10|nr:hypothetical protein [Kutzneria chonburiensis]